MNKKAEFSEPKEPETTEEPVSNASNDALDSDEEFAALIAAQEERAQQKGKKNKNKPKKNKQKKNKKKNTSHEGDLWPEAAIAPYWLELTEGWRPQKQKTKSKKPTKLL